MIVLVNPMFSSSMFLNGDSGYIYLRKMIQAMLKQRPDWRFVMPFPSNREWVYYRDGFFDDPRIIRVPHLLHEGKLHNVVQYDSAFWQNLTDRYPPDIIWCQAVEIAQNLKYVMECYEERARPVVVNMHHYVTHPSLPYPVETQQAHVLMAQLVSAALADVNVFGSEYARWMLDDNIRHYWPNLQYTGETLLMGPLELDLMDAHTKTPYPVATALYNHRIQAYKRPDLTFNAFARVVARHPDDFQVVATVNNLRGKDWLNRDYPFTKVKALVDYPDYLDELSRCHLNVLHTRHETFCISIVESLAHGQLVIVPNGLTFPEITPPDYPYRFDRESEVDGMLEHILQEGLWRPDHPYRAYLRQWTRERFTVEMYAARWIDLFERLNTWEYATTLKPTSVEKIRRITEAAIQSGHRRVAFQRLRNTLAHQMRLGHQAMSPVKLHRILNQIGWRDDPDPRGLFVIAPDEMPDIEAKLEEGRQRFLALGRDHEEPVGLERIRQ